MEQVFCRTENNYDREKVSKETALVCKDKSLAQQNQKAEADINTIVKRFGLTGELPSNVAVPQYGDFTGISDYRTALDAIRKANEQFMILPADLRTKFSNDPEQFVNFCSDPANLEEMVKLGLAVKRAAPSPTGTPEGTGGATPVQPAQATTAAVPAAPAPK